MNRQDRDRNDYGFDYDRNEGYGRDDNRYHRARNLTDEFEREYERDRGRWNDNRNHPEHTYHEGDMGGAYERMQRNRNNYGYGDNRRNSYGGNYGNSYDRNRDYNDSYNYRHDRDRDRDRSGSYNSGYDNDYWSQGRDQHYYYPNDNDRYSRYDDRDRDDYNRRYLNRDRYEANRYY